MGLGLGRRARWEGDPLGGARGRLRRSCCMTPRSLVSFFFFFSFCLSIVMESLEQTLGVWWCSVHVVVLRWFVVELAWRGNGVV